MYECHITYEHVSEAMEACLKDYADLNGWKTSFIDGDPALGPGKRFFLTAHHHDGEALYRKMRDTATDDSLPSPVREKIERIVHDTKYGKVWGR